jgi:hypothetical protein
LINQPIKIITWIVEIITINSSWETNNPISIHIRNQIKGNIKDFSQNHLGNFNSLSPEKIISQVKRNPILPATAPKKPNLLAPIAISVNEKHPLIN